MHRTPSLARALLTLLALSAAPQALADCTADSGTVENIEGPGVTVTCDDGEPNPFTAGIGSVATADDLTVIISEGAAVESSGVGVTLASNGELTNDGSVSGSAEAVLAQTSLGTQRITITNAGSLTSTAGVAVSTGAGNAIIESSGSIEGVDGAVIMTGSELDNSGSISTSAQAATAVSAGTSSVVTNSGTIASDGDAVNLGQGSRLDNSGTISAGNVGVLVGIDASLDNSGSVEATSGAAATLAAGASLTNSGTLRADEAAAIIASSAATVTNTGTVSSSASAAIIATGGVSIDNSGVISGDIGPVVTVTGDGNTLTLRAGADVQGDIEVAAGTLANEWVLLDSGSYNGSAAGFSRLTLRGERWALGGAVEVGTLAIEAGTLTVNGTLDPASSIDLSAGTLAGTGTILADVVNSGGTIAAGDPAGTLTITGNYNQTGSGTLRAQTANTGIGVLQVNGSASLAGTLIVEAGPDTIADVLVADGGVNGFFDTVTVDGRALAAVVPLPNSVRVIRASATLEDNMVEANLDNTYLALDTLSPPVDPDAGSGLWLKGVGHYGERDDADGLPGGDYLLAGAALGGAWRVADHFRLGAAVGYTSLDLDSDDGSDGEADNYNYGVYAHYDNGFLWGGITVVGASGDYDQDRRVVVNGIGEKVPASYDSTSWGVRGNIGTRHDFLGELAGLWVLEPVVGIDYVVADLDSYREASATSLEYSIDDIESLQLSGLLKVRRLSDARTMAAPYFHAGVVHRIALDNREWAAVSPDGGLGLELPGNDDDLTSGAVGAGIEFRFRGRVGGFAEWRGEISDDKQRHAVLAGLRIDV